MTDKMLLLRKMEDEGTKTIAFFRAISDDQWDNPIYTDGAQWDLRQILCHFVDAEKWLRVIVEDIMTGGEGSPEGFDVDLHNAEHVGKMTDWHPEALINAFFNSRQATLELLRKATEADLKRTGRHPAMGIKSLESIAQLIYLHNKAHQRDIQRVINLAG
jgi:hypothetical protein